MKVGVIGAMNLDLIIRGDAPRDIEQLKNWGGLSEVSCLVAGSVGYLSQNFKKLECEVNLVSCITDDAFGAMILSSLNKTGISTEYLLIEPDKISAIGIYILLFGSNKRPITYRLPTHHGWPPKLSEKQKTALLSSDLVHCGGYLHFSDLWNNDLPELFKKAKELGKLTSLDPQFPLEFLNPPWSKVLEPLLKHTDILFVDENEAKGIAATESIDSAIEKLKTLNVPIIIVKMGEKGATLISEGIIIHQDAFPPSQFIDSIGAGDSFDTGFLFSYYKTKDMKKSLEFAAHVASKSCEGVGGTSKFPSYKDIQSIF